MRSISIMWLKCFYCLWNISKLWSFFFSQSHCKIHGAHELVSLKWYAYNFSWSVYLIRFSIKFNSFFFFIISIVNPLQEVFFFFSSFHSKSGILAHDFLHRISLQFSFLTLHYISKVGILIPLKFVRTQTKKN